MSDLANPVVHVTGPESEQQFHDALIVGLSRAAARLGRDPLAEKSRRTRRALDKLFAGDTKDTTGKGLLDFLCADPAALNEVFALYGLQPPRPRITAAANDMVTVSTMSNVVSQFCDALKDGQRDHRETLQLADAIRDLMPALSAILSEANQIKGIAA